MASERLTISLPSELLDFVRERTAGGDYTSDSEVIRDGLRLLKERDEAVKKWLMEQVVPAYLELKADPAGAVSGSELKARMTQQRQQRSTNKKGSTG